jgi:phosphatidylinositol glycan class O
MILLIIDSLRLDFMVTPDEGPRAHMPYANGFPFITDSLVNHSNNSLIFAFEADSPTVTMQRIKGTAALVSDPRHTTLIFIHAYRMSYRHWRRRVVVGLMTGTLPTFIDVADNFRSSLIPEDSLVRQWNNRNRSIVFMGDDTWSGLFDEMFDVSYPEPGYNVKDLHTVDNVVIKYLFPTMKSMPFFMFAMRFFADLHVSSSGCSGQLERHYRPFSRHRSCWSSLRRQSRRNAKETAST